jgi:ribosomal protein S18 acetylase RimI-like enzyme
MVLRTTDIQNRAHKFYESNGYARIKTVDPEYKEINNNLVFFKKLLNRIYH